MGEPLWRELADAQAGLLSHRQLRGLGITRGEIRNHLRVSRWAVRSAEVVSTTTGPLSPEQALWLGVLHGGPSAMVGALSAAGLRGLKRWERDEITILVNNPMSFAPLPGYRFFRTRRPFKVLLGSGELPACRLEPAVLMFAAHEPHLRTALGAVTATVQQRLTTADALIAWLDRLTPLRRSKDLRLLLGDVAEGDEVLHDLPRLVPDLPGRALDDDPRRGGQLAVATPVERGLHRVVVPRAVDLEHELPAVGKQPLGVRVAGATSVVGPGAL